MPEFVNPYRSPSHVADQSHQPFRRSRFAIVFLPAFSMLALFYSLATHMFFRLGRWPKSIGETDFPPSLVVHAWLAQGLFALLALAVFIFPFAVVACVLNQEWQREIKHLVTYAVSMLAGYVAMSLAPSSFWNWWWDYYPGMPPDRVVHPGDWGVDWPSYSGS